MHKTELRQMSEPDFGQTEILNYIERLSEQFGLDVSFHFSRECFMDGKETDLLEKYRLGRPRRYF